MSVSQLPGGVQAATFSGNRASARRAGLPLQRAPHQPLLARWWELRENLTVDDASYVARAEARDLRIFTAARRRAG